MTGMTGAPGASGASGLSGLSGPERGCWWLLHAYPAWILALVMTLRLRRQAVL